ncbi:MAG: hypothetical protein JST85_22395 [Acidobacteria bacterium]|nr:hypothetical protein [Acidobacteriota bacterium]
MNWFDVDKEGLAKLVEKRGREFVVFELIQNAWDQRVSRVEIQLDMLPQRPLARITVLDDDPQGFANLSDAYTLFAESNKKVDPEKRGRFNLGEKLVLALCEEAEVSTTTGTVCFTKQGRRRRRAKLEAGSRFSATIRMTREQHNQVCEHIYTLLPPVGIITTFNGVELAPRQPLYEFEAKLPTEIADEEGILRSRVRSTRIRVHGTEAGQAALLYEMGIPVVATGDLYHVDIGQKVPLNMDRDNVSATFLRQVRTLVLNEMHDRMMPDDANTLWVREAASDRRVSDAAVRTIIKYRFGEKCVIRDPSDPEANNIAVSKGYTLIAGGALTAGEWDNLKRAGAALPAGQVTPSPKPFHPDGESLQTLPENEYTPGIKQTVAYAKALARELFGVEIRVVIANDRGWKFSACYGESELTLNLAKLGHGWFDDGPTERVNELLIHEFGHHFSGNHLSEEYHRALCRLGARMTRLALKQPSLFQLDH